MVPLDICGPSEQVGCNCARPIQTFLQHLLIGHTFGESRDVGMNRKLDAGIDVDKEVLNEESRGHYHEEIVKEVEKLNGYLPEGCGVTLTVPHENFHRDIGDFGGKNCYYRRIIRRN